MMAPPAARQRIDKWLWHARIVRTRTAATELVRAGHIRVNGRRTTAAGGTIRPGDVLTIALDSSVRVVRVEGIGEKRGGPAGARGLYSMADHAGKP